MGSGRWRPKRTAGASGVRGGGRLDLGRGRRLLRSVRVALLEALDAAGGVDELGLAREERMAVRADLEAQLGLRALCLPRVSARAVHGHLVVLGVNFFLHRGLPFRLRRVVSSAGTWENNMGLSPRELSKRLLLLDFRRVHSQRA